MTWLYISPYTVGLEIAQFSGTFDDLGVGVDSTHLCMAEYGYCS
jgi:hypothetical protein